jgi:hypothetical protein
LGDEADTEPRDPEADEVVIETGETNTKLSVPKTAPRVDAEGCRLVREAQA